MSEAQTAGAAESQNRLSLPSPDKTRARQQGASATSGSGATVCIGGVCLYEEYPMHRVRWGQKTTPGHGRKDVREWVDEWHRRGGGLAAYPCTAGRRRRLRGPGGGVQARVGGGEGQRGAKGAIPSQLVDPGQTCLYGPGDGGSRGAALCLRCRPWPAAAAAAACLLGGRPGTHWV